jgi:hypothetical protein
LLRIGASSRGSPIQAAAGSHVLIVKFSDGLVHQFYPKRNAKVRDIQGAFVVQKPVKAIEENEEVKNEC